jgi:molybdopterin/thiamine biosynthesis adenylyltransferase
MLSADAQRRYARQLMLPDFGEAVQLRFHAARVAVIGAGGLGSAVATYLAMAGVGHLTLIDSDRVELSNLNRQILHEQGDIGRLKVESAGDRLSELRHDITLSLHAETLTEANAALLLQDHDIVADGCDNFATRFAVNAACVTLGIPLVSAAIAGLHGQVASFAPTHYAGTACYACMVHPEAPEANSCRESGVIGPLAGIVGSMQALEVLWWLAGTPKLVGSLAKFDGVRFTQTISRIARDENCSVCG